VDILLDRGAHIVDTFGLMRSGVADYTRSVLGKSALAWARLVVNLDQIRSGAALSMPDRRHLERCHLLTRISARLIPWAFDRSAHLEHRAPVLLGTYKRRGTGALDALLRVRWLLHVRCVLA
jgi:hypothetical protein